jgi:hypothetical protein
MYTRSTSASFINASYEPYARSTLNSFAKVRAFSTDLDAIAWSTASSIFEMVIAIFLAIVPVPTIPTLIIISFARFSEL